MEPDALISNIIYRHGTNGVEKFTVQIEYEDKQCSATILVETAQSFPHTGDEFRRELLHLGAALQAAAQSPQGISWSPQEPQ